jgi:hypothetical protein
LSALNSGDVEKIQGADTISLLFPPGTVGGDLHPRAEAIISAFAEGEECEYAYEPEQETLSFFRR